MLQKTQGIALSYVKYKDTSIIARIFTREYGLRSYIVNSVRKKNKGNKMIFFQPLSLLDLVVYENPSKDINRISEVKFSYQTINTISDIKRSSVVIFLCEFLEKLILTEEENESLYDFINSALVDFDKSFDPDFHVNFLLRLTPFLGIDIDPELHLPAHYQNVSRDLILKSNINSSIRKSITFELLNYYKMHLEKNINFKSLPILIEVLHN